MENIVLNVHGMTCSGCVRSVQNVLQALPGVSTVEVSLENAQAKVLYDPQTVDPTRMKEAIESAGYEAG